MPCFFCIAVGGVIAAAVAGSVVDTVRNALSQVAVGPVRVVDDNNEHTQRIELDVPVPPLPAEREKPGPRPAAVPVAVTVYPRYKRVRVQVLTHEVDRREAEAVQDVIVRALGMQVVHRSDHHEQQVVHEAIEELHRQPTAEGVAAPSRQALQEER